MSLKRLFFCYTVLFEQSPYCCWVSRIFEQGNAALTKEKVLLGDHIVAVNETSVVHHNVAQVCKVLSIVEDPSCVELTFIRYIGPIRHSSANMEHEGYEVVDPILSGSQQVKKENPKQAAKGVTTSTPAAAPVSKNARVPMQPAKKNGEANDTKNGSKFKLFKMFKRR